MPEITAADIHRGSYTTEENHFAALIGHDLIKELAYLSETGDFVPDSDLLNSTDEFLKAQVGAQYSFQLSVSGGDAASSWEMISDSGLPEGLSFASDGLVSGTVMDDIGTWNVAFKVTDRTGAFRKAGATIAASRRNTRMRLTHAPVIQHRRKRRSTNRFREIRIRRRLRLE